MVETIKAGRLDASFMIVPLAMKLRAQGVPAFSAAVLGGYLHGRAGELAAATLGTTASVLASDVAAAIPQALAELQAS